MHSSLLYNLVNYTFVNALYAPKNRGFIKSIMIKMGGNMIKMGITMIKMGGNMISKN